MHPDYAEMLKKYKLTKRITIEGKGSIEEYGELNLEKLVKRLLKSKSITG